MYTSISIMFIFPLAAPNHEFSAGFVAQPLDNDYISNYQTYHGLIGAGEVGVLEFDDPPIGT